MTFANVGEKSVTRAIVRGFADELMDLAESDAVIVGAGPAGLVAARNSGIVGSNDVAVLDSTAHALKFSGFQDMYFKNSFPPDFKISPDPGLVNTPVYIHPEDLKNVPAPGKPLSGAEFDLFVKRTAEEIAKDLDLKRVQEA